MKGRFPASGIKRKLEEVTDFHALHCVLFPGQLINGKNKQQTVKEVSVAGGWWADILWKHHPAGRGYKQP